MATSPALDVPPEPPLKRQKVKGESRPNDANTETVLPSTADLAEQLDFAERSKYVKGKKLGSGQYADVFSAHLVADPSKLVAIKKIKVGPEWADFGISFDSLREIRFLQELDHPNIIKMHAVFSTNTQNLNLVLEQLPQGDMLKMINDTSVSYTPADIKAWMLMLCRAVWFCHANYVLHRDIKPNNLLIAANGEIKLADFGLARSFADPFAEMTYNTITLWYRPPELFYQSRYYGGAVDVWSVGCVFAEFIQRKPLFQAIPESELRMVQLISEGVGTPTEENWPGVSKLRGYIAPTEITPVHPKAHWLAHFRSIGDVGVDLLMKMLTLDPRNRPTAEGALMHEYWTSDPRPSQLEHLPKKGGGIEAMGEQLKKRGGEIPDAKEKKTGKGDGRGDRVARKIDFGSLRN